MKKVLLTVILTAISFSQVSALQVDLSNGSGSIEISQKDIGKLTPEQIEQAKIQVPQNFRIRGVLRDAANKPMGNIKVSVIKPSDIQYNVYTDESGVFGLNFNSVIPREVQFSVNDTSFFLKKLPSNLSTYTFILDVKGIGTLTTDSTDIFYSSDQQIIDMPPVIRPSSWLLGIQNGTDAFYTCFAIVMLVISIGMLVVVKGSVSDESANL